MQTFKVKQIFADKRYAIVCSLGGCSVSKEIIPDAVSYLNHYNFLDRLIFDDLNGVEIEIKKGAKVEEVVELYHSKRRISALQDLVELEEWMPSKEGIESRRKIEERSREYKKTLFKDVKEAIGALKKVKKVNLTSEETSFFDAHKMCKEVMKILLKCEGMKFDDFQCCLFSKALKDIGCTTYNLAHKKFKDCHESNLALMYRPKNIQFPLSVFTQLIDTNPSTFNYAMERMTERGAQDCWVATWLKCQERPNIINI